MGLLVKPMGKDTSDARGNGHLNRVTQNLEEK